MFNFESLENKNLFEVGRRYYYHYSCNYDTLSWIEIVSISDTRKTAMVQELIGGEPHGKPERKKIHHNGKVETISAGNYSMAGIWSADCFDKSKLFEDLGIDAMYAAEKKDDIKALGLPEEHNTAARFTVTLTLDKSFGVNNYVRFEKMALSAVVNFLYDNAEKLAGMGIDSITWDLYDSEKDNYNVSYGFINSRSDFDLMQSIENECSEKYYEEILFSSAAELFSVEQFGEIVEACEKVAQEFRADMRSEISVTSSNPETAQRSNIVMTSNDEEPDPTDPTPTKPDTDATYSDFDKSFKSWNIISVSFGGAQNAAEGGEVAKTPKAPKHKKLTEKEWKRQLEEKAAFDAAEAVKAEQLINNKLRAAKIDTKIVEKSTPDFPEIIVKIDLEELDDDYFNFTCWTDCGSCYDINDFFDDEQTGEPANVIFCPETEQEAEQDSEQLTFDDLAAMISANALAEPLTVSPSAAESATIGGKACASPDLRAACTMSAPVRPAPNRSKTARRLWWGVGVPPNSFKKLRRGVVVAAWWRGCEENCTG